MNHIALIKKPSQKICVNDGSQIKKTIGKSSILLQKLSDALFFANSYQRLSFNLFICLISFFVMISFSSLTYAYTKTPYIVTNGVASTTPATTIPAGSTVRFVLDMTPSPSTAIPASSDIVKLNDMLAAGFTSVTAPSLPTGWSSPVTAVAGAASPGTNIAQWLSSSNQAPTLSSSLLNATAAPNYGNNSSTIKYQVVPPTTSYTSTATGDGWIPVAVGTNAPSIGYANYPEVTNTGASGNAVKYVVALSHHSFSGPSPAQLTCMNVPAATACGIVTLPTNVYTPQEGNVVQVGQKLYFPVIYDGGTYTRAEYQCIDVSGASPSSCGLIDPGSAANDTNYANSGNFTANFKGPFTDGQYLYMVGWQKYTTGPYAGFNVEQVIATPVGGPTVSNLTIVTPLFTGSGSGGILNAATDTANNNAYFSDTTKLGCFHMNGTGTVTDCATGSSTTFTSQNSGGNGVVLVPNSTGGVAEVCVGANGSGLTTCYTPTLTSTTTKPSGSTNMYAATMIIPGTGKILTADGSGSGVIYCTNAATGANCATNSPVTACTPAGNWLGAIPTCAYGFAMLDQTTNCFVSYGDAAKFEFWTANANNTITSGCTFSNSVTTLGVIPDPMLTHCGPTTTAVNWTTLNFTGMPAGSGTVTFTAADGSALPASITPNPIAISSASAGGSQLVTIPFTYAQYKTFGIKVVYATTGTTTTNMSITANHTTSNSAGPQVCFDATLPATCPTGSTTASPTTPLNQFSVTGATVTGINTTSNITTTTNGTAQSYCTVPPSLTVSKSATPSTFKVGASGQSYSITIVVANGPTTAPILITDALPSGVTLSGTPTATGGTITGCPSTGSNLTGCSIAAGVATGNIVVNVPVSVAAAAVVGSTGGNNTANVSGGGSTCTTSAPCSGSVVVPVLGLPTVAITKTIATPAYQKAGTFNFTVTGATASTPASGTTASTDTISTSTSAFTAVAGLNSFTGAAGTAISFAETSNTAAFANGATLTTAAAATPTSVICTDSNASVTGNTPQTLLATSTPPWQLPAASVTYGAVWVCNFVNSNLPRLSVQKKPLGGTGTFNFTLGGVQ